MPESRIDLAVFISRFSATCDDCEEELGRHAWIRLIGDRKVLCLVCADLDHLVFLPSGNAALTIRSKKYSTLWALVLRWSAARKRYERQGMLVQEQALETAQAECLANAELREDRRVQRAEKLAELDHVYVRQFAAAIREQYPSCPDGREVAIAEHACAKYSRRIGRTRAAKQLDRSTLELAVRAHLRHFESEYDLLLAHGVGRQEARAAVSDEIQAVLQSWGAARESNGGGPHGES